MEPRPAEPTGRRLARTPSPAARRAARPPGTGRHVSELRRTKSPEPGPKDPTRAGAGPAGWTTRPAGREVSVMRSRVNRRPGENLARLARWLGFDRNPLRRGTDRVEAVLRLVMIIVVVAVVPATAVAAGRWADHYFLHQAQARQAADHQVTAVLLRDAPAIGTTDPYTSVPTAWVPARWQPPGQPTRTGEVLAAAG